MADRCTGIQGEALPASDQHILALRRQLLLGFCQAMEAAGIAYVILAGYQGYPDRIESDVDFMVTEDDFARLPALFNRPDFLPGARLLQALQHETTACYYVMAQQ